MAQGRSLRQLIRAGAAGGGDAFRRAAEQVIQEERERKHHLLANDLERILYGERGESYGAGPPSAPLPEVPRDRERGLALLEVREPVRDLDDLVISDHNRSVIDEVLLEQGRDDVLGSYGLRPLSRLLLCGPPGCGKTLTAEVIASQLRLLFVVIRFDAVISSFLGETAANLRRVMDFIAAGRFVVLFDEFDAIGKERSDPSEHGELKRVVNSVLQMFDGFRGKSVIIAASNHERLLDQAVWRRFDEVLLFEKPNLDQIRKLLATKLRGVRSELPDDVNFLNRFTGLTHADIERVLTRAIKAMVLQGREVVAQDLVEDALRREQERRSVLTRM
jgi:SpoVK/Ycf46/Vps4 family AAA+-type ATPase